MDMKMWSQRVCYLHMTPAENFEQNISDEFHLVFSEPATIILPLHCRYMDIIIIIITHYVTIEIYMYMYIQCTHTCQCPL